MSYNVRSLRDDPVAVIAVIRSVHPDIVCLQEAPRFWRWRARCAALARRSDLLVACGGRDAGANVMLVGLRAHVLHAQAVVFPRRPGLHQRGVALAVLRIGAARLAVAGTHLGLDPAERAEHAGLVVDLLTGLGEPNAVLAADVNDVPGSPAWWTLATDLNDVAVPEPTFPAAAPVRRIDGLFASATLTTVGHPVVDGTLVTRASDHLPVVVDLLITDGPG
jgi:endonuclease/exonuclease/phosphatase family metal-dependent hydrolase